MELKELQFVEFEEIEDHFRCEDKDIFRLELLQAYSVEYELEAWNDFLSGKPANKEMIKDWCDTVSSAVERGVLFNRVRLVNNPISDYLKFEYRWGYQFSTKAGEKINIIESNKWPLFKSEVPFLMDFWLFGNSHCYLMCYDLLGRHSGTAKIPNEAVSMYVSLKNEAVSLSSPIEKTSIFT